MNFITNRTVTIVLPWHVRFHARIELTNSLAAARITVASYPPLYTCNGNCHFSGLSLIHIDANGRAELKKTRARVSVRLSAAEYAGC